MMEPIKPKSLKAEDEKERRRALLRGPNVIALAEYVESLRRESPNDYFPDFDPLDGGVNAEILFLFEKPGPMTSAKNGGSGFISRDNDDPTAEATFGFMREAGIARNKTVIWNVVPGWDGDRAIKGESLGRGIESLKKLIPHLPRLRLIVLVGRKAQRARTRLSAWEPKLNFAESAHPSPIVRATRPEGWTNISADWAKAAKKLEPR